MHRKPDALTGTALTADLLSIYNPQHAHTCNNVGPSGAVTPGRRAARCPRGARGSLALVQVRDVQHLLHVRAAHRALAVVPPQLLKARQAHFYIAERAEPPGRHAR